ncbi:unnamed protein product [Lota lota]
MRHSTHRGRFRVDSLTFCSGWCRDTECLGSLASADLHLQMREQRWLVTISTLKGGETRCRARGRGNRMEPQRGLGRRRLMTLEEVRQEETQEVQEPWVEEALGQKQM